MVLAALGDFIYHCYMLLYYIIRVSTFVGYLLYDTLSKIGWAVLWCVQNVSVFARIVYEDNHHHIQDVRTILGGTSDFFISNLVKVCSAVWTVCCVFREALIRCWTLLWQTVWCIKRSLVLIGEAVWLLFTAPYQLLVLLDELLCYGTQQTLQLARNTATFCANGVVDIVHYTIHDVPLESALGLVLLGLIYLNPGPAKCVLQFLLKAARFAYRVGRAKAQRVVATLNDKLSRIALAAYIRILIPLGELLRRYLHGTLHLLRYDRIRSLIQSIPLNRNMLELSTPQENQHTERNNRQEPPAALPPPPPPPPPRRRSTPQRAKIGSCIICEDDDRTIVFVPCGHLCVCKTCARNIAYYNPVCPVCRTHIEKQLKVYL
uniref:RING-type domain-containing protein n=2 Tax=gambiae species complex TaxID=44542 RepID=A0A1S4HCF5_ANOGA